MPPNLDLSELCEKDMNSDANGALLAPFFSDQSITFSSSPYKNISCRIFLSLGPPATRRDICDGRVQRDGQAMLYNQESG